MMGSFIFDIALGRVGQLCKSINDALLPHDAIVWRLLQGAGLETDPSLRQRLTMADILTGTSVEASFSGYAPITHRASIVSAVDLLGHARVVNDTTDPTWSPTSAQLLGKIIACYDPDSTSGTDADLIPLFADDFAGTTPTSGAILYPISNNGFFYEATG